MRKLLPLVILALSLALPASAETVRLLANTSPPYADKTLPEGGLALELVTHVMKRAGYEPDISIEGWSRAMEGVRLGVYDALATAWYTDERGKEFLFSDPYLESELIIVKLRSDLNRYDDLMDLSDRRLGVRVDYAYGVDFSKIPGLVLVEQNYLIQNLMKLLNGDLNLVIGDQRTMAMQLQDYLKNERHKFQVVQIPLPKRYRHVAASRAVPGSAAMIAAFNKALAESIADGSHAAIVEKWDKRYSIPRD